MLRLSISICFLLSIILGIVSFSNFKKERLELTEYAVTKYDDVFLCGEHDLDDYKAVYETRVDDYSEKKDSVLSSMKFFAIFLLLGLFVLFYRPEKFKVPFLNIEVPLNLIYVFIILGFIYLWGQFWLTFNAGLEGRVVLEHVVGKMEETTKVNYHYSQARTLMDNGFIDTWCTFYHDVFKGGQEEDTHRTISGVYLFGSYALLWGFLFAVCFSSASMLFKKESKLLSRAMFLATLWVMLFSSVLFMYWVPHGILFIAWVWFVTGIALLLWFFFGIKIADRIEQLKLKLEQ